MDCPEERYTQITTRLGATIKSVHRGLNVYDFVPRKFKTPCAIIQPVQNKTVDYLQTFSSDFAAWRFTIAIVVGEVSVIGSQAKAGRLIAPGGHLIRALRESFPCIFITYTSISENTFKTDATYTYARIDV